jgi:hypothetical protein
VFLVFFLLKCAWYTPLVGLFKVDCGVPRSILLCIGCNCGGCYGYLADTVAHWNRFGEFVFGSLHSGASVDNEIGPEGAKTLGDALKNNTTLTSFSLNLDCE